MYAGVDAGRLQLMESELLPFIGRGASIALVLALALAGLVVLPLAAMASRASASMTGPVSVDRCQGSPTVRLSIAPESISITFSSTSRWT